MAKILRKTIIDPELYELSFYSRKIKYRINFIRETCKIIDEKMNTLIERGAQSVAQNAIYAFLTPKQVSNKVGTVHPWVGSQSF